MEQTQEQHYYELMDGNRQTMVDGFSLDELKQAIIKWDRFDDVEEPGYVHMDGEPLPLDEQKAFLHELNQYVDWKPYFDIDAKYDAQRLEA